MKKTLLILPSLNEGKNLEILIKRVFKTKYSLDILIINDETNAVTLRHFLNLKKRIKRKNIFFKLRKKRLGVGKAQKDGLNFAYNKKYDYAITMDTDLAHHPRYFKNLLKNIKKNHLVVGSRFIKKDSTPGISSFRNFLSNSAFFVTKLLFGHTYDSTNSFRCYNLNLIEKKFLNFCKSNDYDFFFTSMAYFNKKKYSIRQFPMKIYGRKNGYSKMKISHILKSISMMGAVYFKILFIR